MRYMYIRWIKCPQETLIHHTWSCKDAKNVEIHMREEGTKVYGKLNNFKSFANTPGYLKTELSASSFLPCYSLLPPRVTTNSWRQNRAPCAAGAGKDLKTGTTLPKRKAGTWESHSLEDWALLEAVQQTWEEAPVSKCIGFGFEESCYLIAIEVVGVH